MHLGQVRGTTQENLEKCSEKTPQPKGDNPSKGQNSKRIKKNEREREREREREIDFPNGLSPFYKDKVQLQNQLQSQATTLLNKIDITSYFENLIVELHALYTLNTHIKFCVNRILFTI